MLCIKVVSLITVMLLPRLIAAYETDVKIFHVIDNALWGEPDGSALQGKFSCGSSIRCEILSSDLPTKFMDTVKSKFANATAHERRSSDALKRVSVGMYNIHTWGDIVKWPHPPDLCSLPTDLTVVESEESHKRFKRLFETSFPLFDGNSTTSPYSTVQRTYVSVMNASQFLPIQPFSTLIKGSTFVASTCHRGKGTTNREELVKSLQQVFRVDSLGKCMKSPVGPEGITLSTGTTALRTLFLKRKALSQYLFYLAFENTIEPGYVTEKVFDALIAGTVPVYLGAAADCRKLLPHHKAAIFLDDFNGNIESLAAHLKYLSTNASAYEEHRAWRKAFDPTRQSTLLTKSWPCRLCEWAERKFKTETKKKKHQVPTQRQGCDNVRYKAKKRIRGG